VALPLQELGWPRTKLTALVSKLLAAVALTDRADAWPRQPSGGEMQRMSRALASSLGAGAQLDGLVLGKAAFRGGEAAVARAACTWPIRHGSLDCGQPTGPRPTVPAPRRAQAE
jgi:hypothetical protein